MNMKKRTVALALALCALVVSCKKSDVNAKNNVENDVDQEMLVLLAKNDALFEARHLIESGADINANDEDGEPPLIRATRKESKEAVRLLIAAGALVNARDKDGTTALMYAAENGSEDIAKALIDAGAYVNAKGVYGNTALVYAAKANAVNAVDVAKLLIASGADVNATNDYGDSALMYAAENCSEGMVKTLIAAGAHVNAKGVYGKTPLIYVIDRKTKYNAVDVAKLLIAAGADVNETNDYGVTALMYAAHENAADFAKLLIESGADVNAKDSSGSTALMFAAAEYDNSNVAEILIQAGADINARNDAGKTAYMIAEKEGFQNIMTLLESSGAKQFDEAEFYATDDMSYALQKAAAEQYKIGDKGPGGGIVFYYSEEGFPVQDSDDASPVICHYLECSPEELGKITWCSLSCWKNGGCNFDKTTDDVGAGKLNTAHIANYEHEEPLTPSNCAAYACLRYSTETTKEGEWYLPSKMELNLIYEYFQKSGKIVSDEWYWSSSEYNDYYMWCQRLSNGSNGCTHGNDSCRVRAVRAF